MLSTDTQVLNVLLKAKEEGNTLLSLFDIKYPDKSIESEKNGIHVACVTAENHKTGNDFQQFQDLVEIVITTRKLRYHEGVRVIKAVSKEIIRLLKKDDYLGQRIFARTISPIHEKDTYRLKKGHILLQFITPPIKWEDNTEDIDCICRILTENTMVR